VPKCWWREIVKAPLLGGDNSELVAADTVKNTVYVMAEIVRVLRKAKGGHLKKLKSDL
jgi:urate oxidase